MNEKITLEQFLQIKNQLSQLFEEYKNYIDKHEKDENYNEELIVQRFIDQYLEIQNRLLNYDLSDIPFDAWQDLFIISDKTNTLDLSKTRANIDFGIFEYYGSVNFKGCNVINLEKIPRKLINSNDFDEQTIQKNSSLFLINSFDENFKNKYYNCSLTIDDLASLSASQLEEIIQKDFKLHMIRDSYNAVMLETLGLDKVVQLYNYSHDEYESISKILDASCLKDNYFDSKNSNVPTFEEFLEQIKNVDISEIKNVCFDFAKQKIINSTFWIEQETFPETFISENADIFLIDANVPDEVKERYFRRELKIQDLLDYPEAFQNILVDNFIEYGTHISQFVRDNYGLDKFQELIHRYPNIFAHISQENEFWKFNQFLKKGKDLESAFLEAVKNYFIHYGMPEEFKVVSEGQTINVPEWLSSMNFQFVEKLNTTNDLLQYTDSVFVLDNNQRRVLDTFNIENIRRLEQETGFFSHKYYEFSSDLEMFNVFSSYFSMNNPSSLIKLGIDFKNGSLSYEEFLDQFASLLDAMRKNEVFAHVSSYDWMQGPFRDNYPDLFMDLNAPEELKQAFYKNRISPEFLFEHKEYIPYLINKNLSNSLNANIKLNLPGPVDEQGHMLPISSNFIDEYVARYGNEKLLQLISKYGVVLSNITISSMHGEIDNEQAIEQSLKNSISSKIIKEEMEYSYLSNIPDFVSEHPELFIDKNAPQELQEALYNRTISPELILYNPSYIEYLKNIDLSISFSFLPTYFINYIEQTFGKDDAFKLLMIYGKYLNTIFDYNKMEYLELDSKLTKEEVLVKIDNLIMRYIIEGKLKYDENISSHFKNNNPTLFLNENISQEIKNKFYNRQFTLQDFNDNPNLLELFDKTNIAFGFSQTMAWVIPLFDDSDNMQIANYNRMKVISAYSKINDVLLQNEFKIYIMKFENNIDIENLEYVSDVLLRLSLSNSSEIRNFKIEIAKEILKSQNTLENLNKIEDIFIKNNIPTIGKVYSCFEILHPEFQGFDFNTPCVSPVLKKSSTLSKKIIVFSDLIKSSFGSNNKSVNAYLKNIEIGYNLYECIKSGKIQFDMISEEEKQELKIFSKHLVTLYNNTMKAKKENEIFQLSGDVVKDIFELSKKLSPNGNLDYNLADRVVRMFCGFAGIDTLEQAKKYISTKIQSADLRNREASKTDMILNQGDYVKGIGDIIYLRNILQNGSVSKEYLGSSASSDLTPLDTDVSMIMSSNGTIAEKMERTMAFHYGPIWLVLRNDDRFITTRTINGLINQKRDLSKMESFYTGVVGEDHYGIRTGFASSEINYIVMEKYDPRVGLEIAMNGFYIPISNMEGEIIFTPKDYDNLREKMSGLSYFDEQNYSFSENLITEETEYFAQQIEESNNETQYKKEKIYNVIKKPLEELGLQLKTNIDGDLTEGVVELIDTGSTGRGTNKPGDGDFDFMMRLDRTILLDNTKLSKLKQTILKSLGKENSFEITTQGDFRLKDVQIDTDVEVDIDITFIGKTDKVTYSTDMALKDRLDTIKRINPEKYEYVVANILLAKQVLKDGEIYKPYQGGLGGVGIENWILQNGGSFIDAAKSFLETADGKNFSEFVSSYQIWNFGENHLAERNGEYIHNNFVENNMSEFGYDKMVLVLEEYLKTYEINQMQTGNITR